MNHTAGKLSWIRPSGSGWFLAILILALAPVMALAEEPASSREESAQSEDPAKLIELGNRHYYGVRAPQDIDKAIQLYCAAARLGSGEAQFRLGEIYSRSLAGKKDEVLGAAWLQRAMLSNFRAARSRLARWDLTGVNLASKPQCRTSGEMVARTLPRARRATPAQPGLKTPAAAMIAGNRARNPKISKNPERREIERLVRDLAPRYRLNPALVMAIIEAESNFNAKALSPKSAQGLMQLIPATAKRFGVSDPWDPHQNLHGGMAYLRWLLDYFNGDVRLALAGYNAGEKAVKRYGDVPPYNETQNYLHRIARILGVPADKLTSVQSGSVPTIPGSTRSAVFTKTRKPDAKGDWESRFFAVATSG